MVGIRRRLAAGGLVIGLGVGASWTAGCATYANYPAVDGDVAVNDPNVAPLPSMMTVAMGWLMDRYPAEGAYVVNWPRGMDRARAKSMVELVGPDARVVSPETEGLPVYHVSRVWLRGDRGEVDVMRPVAQGEGGYQTVTVHLRSELGRWEIANSKVWPMGMASAPELYGWDD